MKVKKSKKKNPQSWTQSQVSCTEGRSDHVHVEKRMHHPGLNLRSLAQKGDLITCMWKKECTILDSISGLLHRTDILVMSRP